MRPDLAEGFPARAAGYGLATGGLLAALVWNDYFQPDWDLDPIDMPRKHARSPLSCSLRAKQRAQAKVRSKQLSMSLNAYLEALIAAEMARPPGELVILFRPQ